jgi:hypothetical protein
MQTALSSKQDARNRRAAMQRARTQRSPTNLSRSALVSRNTERACAQRLVI